jgi:hydroxymethylbilane synthase
MRKGLKVGTRKSEMALGQTSTVVQKLQTLTTLEVEIVPIVTTGDRRGEEKQEDKKEWIIELEEALVSGEIDCAVHSGKDVPADIHAETALLPVLERDDPRDIFISRAAIIGESPVTLSSLPPGALIGTASLRRSAQLKLYRPDLNVEPLRGNVPTRIKKLKSDNKWAGIILAKAGLKRLGIDDSPYEALPLEQFVPAMNQGILVMQYRKLDFDLESLFKQLVSNKVYPVWQAERAVISALGADCRSAVGVYGEIKEEIIHLFGQNFVTNGSHLEMLIEGQVADSVLLGRSLGEAIKDKK